MSQRLEATFSALIMSIGSTALMSLGQVPNPTTGKTSIDLDMARFNIDLLMVLQEKTQGRLTEEEQKFLTAILSDLQLKYIEAQKKK